MIRAFNYHVLEISIVAVLASFIFYALHFLSSELKDYKNTTISMFIGIVSRPENVQQRQSLRETWLQTLPDSFHYRFLVGKELCNIPPSDLRSQYNCEPVNVVIPEDTTDKTVFHVISVDSSCVENVTLSIGFSFHVHQPIIVHYLGIKQQYSAAASEKVVRVTLQDLHSSSKIASVTFSSDAVLGNDNQGYVYKKVRNSVVLPKGFEGRVEVEGANGTPPSEGCRGCVKWTHGNLLTVLDLISNTWTGNETCSCVMSTFSFTVKDTTEVKSHIRLEQLRLSKWSEHVEVVKKNLHEEAATHGDILLLNMVDVYRNLPQKLLLFLKWIYRVNHDVDYMLKTDDDTFIDIMKVKRELDKNIEWDWWSCFRIGWPVQRYGKWQESAYLGEIYPPFPSGAGYVLSKRVLHWLNSQSEKLSTSYQGEDVAMGIWLEALNPSRHVGETCYWACNEHCHAQTCSAMQLTVEGMYQMWHHFRSCGSNICNCPTPEG